MDVNTTKIREAAQMEAALERFIVQCRAKNLSPRTVEWYNNVLYYLGEFLEWPNIQDITPENIQDYTLKAMETANAQTAQGRIRAYRVFFNWAMQAEIIDRNPMDKVSNLKLPQAKLKVLSDQHVAAMFRQCDKDTPIGIRDYCILAMLLDTGLRAMELCGLTMDKLDLRGGCVTVIGKGSKERTVHFSEKLRRDLITYLRMREKASWGRSNFVFPSNRGMMMGLHGLEQLTQRLADKAGLGISARPHRLRHTSGTVWIERGGDPLTLQQRMGHANLATTRIYVTQRAKVLQEKAQQFSPYEAIEQNENKIRLPKRKKR